MVAKMHKTLFLRVKIVDFLYFPQKFQLIQQFIMY